MSWEEINQNLSTRKNDSMATLIQELKPCEKINTEIIIIQSSSDLGVILNGGRSGSLYGPRAILGGLKKMSKHGFNKSITAVETCHNKDILPHGFKKFQSEQVEKITTLLENKSKTIVHLASGHDFIYPFAKSVAQSSSKIAIINFDAHLDTRVDPIHHSGTPFRQLSLELKDRMKLIQIGIHNYSNASSNFSDIDMQIISTDEVKNQTKKMTSNIDFINSIFKSISDFDTIILSLDLDAIKSEQMGAVSAPNHYGLDLEFICDFIKEYKKLKSERKFLGIYEYNPLFDDLAISSARRINSLIQEFIK